MITMYLDSASLHHLLQSEEFLDLVLAENVRGNQVCEGSVMIASKKGIICAKLGKVNVKINDILVVKGLHKHLSSIGKMTKAGFDFYIIDTFAYIYEDKKLVAKAEKKVVYISKIFNWNQ